MSDASGWLAGAEDQRIYWQSWTHTLPPRAVVVIVTAPASTATGTVT